MISPEKQCRVICLVFVSGRGAARPPNVGSSQSSGGGPSPSGRQSFGGGSAPSQQSAGLTNVENSLPCYSRHFLRERPRPEENSGDDIDVVSSLKVS